MVGSVLRRGVVAAVMIAALVLAAPAAPSSPASPADQATAYQLDATHDGSIADAGLTAPLTQAWSIPMSDASYSLIADGMVFVTTTTQSGANSLTALNQATGATIWSHPVVGVEVVLDVPGLAYDRGRVFMTNRGVLTAFEAATGAVAWSQQLPGQATSSYPTAVNGIVYVGGLGRGPSSVGGTLYAVRESDGAVLWSHSGLDGASVAAVTAQGVYFSEENHVAQAFDPLLGTELWHLPCPYDNCGSGNYLAATPVVANAHDLMRDTLGSLVLSAATGAVEGTLSTPSDSIPAVANDTAYTTLGNGGVNAIANSGLGSYLWGANIANASTPSIVVGGLVFVGSGSTSGNDHVYAFDASTGAAAWSTDLGETSPFPRATSLSAANGTLVVSTATGVVAYRSAGAITQAPSNQSPPTISGSADLNEMNAADVGIWSGLPSAYSYQWELCDAAGANCADIPGATSLSYAPGADAYGATLRVRVSAANGVGSSSPVESAASAVLGLSNAPPAFSTAPVLIGTGTVSELLSTTNGTWTNSATSYAYQWQRCDETGSNCVDIAGATNSAYTPVKSDIGLEIRSEARASNAVGTAPSGYAPSAPTRIWEPRPADEATAFQLDAAHDGSIPDAGLAAPFTQAWSVTLPGTPSSSLIAQGMVFVTSNSTLYAINQATGSTIGHEGSARAEGLRTTADKSSP